MVVIDRIEITSYGGIRGRTLELTPGTNVISAPNEWGKTTTVSFVKFAFYGLPKSRKKLELADYERRRMAPWDGAPMEGAVEFSKDGVSYRLYRQLTERREVVRLTETATGRELDLAGAAPGEAVFGLDAGSFERTICTAQQGVEMSEHGALETRLRNLVTSGEEDVSYERAVAALETAQKRYRHKKGSAGGLSRLEAELTRCAQEYERSVAGYDRYLAAKEDGRAAEAELARCEAETGALMAQAGRSEARVAAEALRRIEALSAEREVLRTRLRALDPPDRETLDDLQLRLESQRHETEKLGALRARAETAEAERERAAARLRELPKAPEGAEEALRLCARRDGFLLPLGIVLCAMGLLAGGLMAALLGLPYGAPGLAAALAGGALCAVGLRGRRRREAALARCGARNETELRETLARLETEWTRLSAELARAEAAGAELAAELREREAALAAARRDLAARCGAEDIAGALSAERELVREGERLSAELALCEARLADAGAERIAELRALAASLEGEEPLSTEELQRRLAQVKERAAACRARYEQAREVGARYEAETPLPGAVEAERERLSRALDRARVEDGALTLAGELLREAHSRVQARFAPELNRRAAAYFEEITGGKYGRMQIDHRYRIAIFDAGDYRELGYFSAGTRDAAYLALRLAVTELLFPGELPPAFFDDSFTRLDGERLRRLLGLYGRSGRQLVVFTCDGREKELLG